MIARAPEPSQICHTLAEVAAAGYAAGLADPPLSQEQADLVAAILASAAEPAASAA